jgi:hypothetical protein
MDTFEKIDELLQLFVGQFVWSVRRGVGTFLTMQFGEPHRLVREPIQARGNADAVVGRTLGRRLISIKGDVSLFIQDSQWSISTKDAVVNWDSDEASMNEMIVYHLDGQRVLSARRGADDTLLEFDLGTTLRLGKSIFPTDMTSVLWTIRPWGGSSVGLFNSGAAIPPDWKYSEDADTSSNLPTRLPPFDS